LSGIVATLLEYLFQFTKLIHLPSYALAIVILTVFIKAVLFPLNQKQSRSMRQMQLAQPLMEEINKKYAGNKQKQSEEMMKLYQKLHLNPMAGCLPLLIQMPIIIVLYQGMIHFMPQFPEYNSFFWVANLSVPSAQEAGLIGWIFPVLAGLATFGQSYLMSGKTAQSNSTAKIMLYFTPVMMIWIGRTVPAGVCLYWVVFSILGTIQQFYINKKPVPEIMESKESDKKDPLISKIEKINSEEKAEKALAKAGDKKELSAQDRALAARQERSKARAKNGAANGQRHKNRNKNRQTAGKNNDTITGQQKAGQKEERGQKE